MGLDIASHGDTVYVVVKLTPEALNTNRIFVFVSYHGGFALENNNWMVMSCPASGPDGVIIDDTLYSTFRNGAGGMYTCYVSKLSLSAMTLGSAVNVTAPFMGLNQQNYPRIATDGSAMAIVWRQRVNGSVQLPVSFTGNIANEFLTAYDTVDMDNITNADVAMYAGNLWVEWQDDLSGNVKFRQVTYNYVATLNLPAQSTMTVFPNPSNAVAIINTSEREISSVSIRNTTGEKVDANNRLSGYALANYSLQLRDMPCGSYFIHIITIKDQKTLFF